MRSLAAVFVVGMLALPTLPQQDRSDGTWEAEFRATRMHLNLRIDRNQGYSNYGRTIPIADLSNFRRSGRNVSFELRRPAGVFRFEGVGSEDRAAGTYEFTSDVAFRRTLESNGFSGLDERRMLIVAIHNVTSDDVRYLQRGVRGGINTADLIRMLDHGAGPEFVRGVYAAGFSNLSADELTRTRDHGVDPEFIEGMRREGIRLTLDEYVRARDHGVDPRYIRALRELGFRNDFAQLVRARDHGVDARFVRDLSEAGLRDLTLSHYVELRDHGVTEDFVLGMRELGYTRLNASELIRLQNHGVTPAFVRRANRDAGRTLAVDELVDRKSRGH